MMRAMKTAPSMVNFFQCPGCPQHPLAINLDTMAVQGLLSYARDDWDIQRCRGERPEGRREELTGQRNMTQSSLPQKANPDIDQSKWDSTGWGLELDSVPLVSLRGECGTGKEMRNPAALQHK